MEAVPELRKPRAFGDELPREGDATDRCGPASLGNYLLGCVSFGGLFFLGEVIRCLILSGGFSLIDMEGFF